MKIRNTSRFQDRFVRRMFSWIVRQLDIPRRDGQRGVVREVWFRNRRYAYSGHCHANRIIVSVGTAGYPAHASWMRAYKPIDGSDDIWLMDSIEGLVYITAHELGHLQDFRVNSWGRGAEARADAIARKILRDFRERRDDLVEAWNHSEAEAEAPAEPTATSAVAARELKAISQLARWQKRLKIAQARVKKYARTVNYYEKRKAASHAGR